MRFKKIVENAFMFLGVIGIVDITIQLITNEKVKVIHLILDFFFL